MTGTRHPRPALALLALLALSAPTACGAEDAPASPTPEAVVAPTPTVNPEAKRLEDLPPGVNAVVNEMRLLDAAMRDTLTLLANGHLEPIPARIFAVHGARDLTEHAIAAGAYLPPRTDAPIEAFVATDRAFHDDLVRLVRAARANDLEAATRAYADVVVGCTACHQRFRFDPAE